MTRSRLHHTVAVLVTCCLAAGCRDHGGPGAVGRVADPPRANPAVDAALDVREPADVREGLAAAIVIDVSGSMNDRVTGEGGRRARKIDVARRAARDLVEQFAAYADKHAGEPVLLGVYEFSSRAGQPDCRPIMPMAPPDRARAEDALARLDPDGGTPIGQAMVTAKHALDATGLSRRHLLIVSDGENTTGFEPEEIAAGISRRPAGERPAIYFVAFDIDASRFNGLREAGGLVLSAASARELHDTLDMLLTDNILLER